jgi:hypothetical protein
LGRSNIRGPYRAPSQCPVCAPTIAQIGAPIRSQKHPDVELDARDDLVGHRGGGHACQEEQRVAGEEEADQQPGLGEEDGEHADQPERPQQVGRVERVDRQNVGGEGTGRHGEPGYRPRALPVLLITVRGAIVPFRVTFAP